MTIEFRCPKCSKLLNTADGTAGRKAICPECQSKLIVPDMTPSAAEGDSGTRGAATEPSGRGSPFSQASFEQPEANPYESPTSASHQPYQGVPRSRSLDIGDILSRTWALYTDQLGLVLGASLLAIIVPIVISTVAMMLGFMLFGLGAVIDPVVGVLVAIVLMLIITFILIGVSIWLTLGMMTIMLKVARGQPADFGDLFSAGEHIGHAIIASFLIYIAVMLGMLACWVPGIIFALMFSQSMFLIIDRKAAGMESLSMSSDLVYGNKAQLFLLNLVLGGISMLVSFLLIGGIFFLPFMMLSWAVVYVQLSGEPGAPYTR